MQPNTKPTVANQPATNNTGSPSINPTTRPFMERRFSGQRGWLCIGYIDGDPRFEPLREEWYQWPRQKKAALLYLAYLTDRGFNTYVGQCLFTKKRRSYATALPSRWLWQDDTPADLPCTELIETSPENYQAWIELDRPLDATERSALQRRWRDKARKSAPAVDDCSADAVHMVRVPGGRNTKCHQQHAVTIAYSSDRIFDAPQVIEDTRQADAGSEAWATIDQAKAEQCRGNIDPILDRVRRRMPKPARDTLNNPASAPSHSEARFRVIGGIMQLPDEEIAALICYWSDAGPLSWGHLEGKSLKAKLDDIARCIGKHEERMARRGYQRPPTPTRASGLLPPQSLTKPKARSDRPRKLDDAYLFAWYVEQANSGVVFMTVGEVAAAHDVSDRTIQRIEGRLKERRLISRESRQHQSLIRILRSSPPARGDNIAAMSPLATADLAHTTAQNDNPNTLYNHTPLVRSALPDDQAPAAATDFPLASAEIEAPAVVPPMALHLAGKPVAATSVDFSGDGDATSLSVRPLTLGELVHVCFARRGVVDAETGEVKRLTCSDAVIRRAITAERQRQRAAVWNEERAKIAALDNAELVKTVGARQRTLARGIGKPRESYHQMRLTIADEERQRRGLELPAPRSVGHSPRRSHAPGAAHQGGVSVQATRQEPRALIAPRVHGSAGDLPEGFKLRRSGNRWCLLRPDGSASWYATREAACGAVVDAAEKATHAVARPAPIDAIETSLFASSQEACTAPAGTAAHLIASLRARKAGDRNVAVSSESLEAAGAQS